MTRLPVFDSNYTFQYRCVSNYLYNSLYYLYISDNDDPEMLLQFDSITIGSDPDSVTFKYYAKNIYGEILFTNTNFRVIKKQVLEYLRSTKGLRKILIRLYENVSFLETFSHIIDRNTLKNILFKSYEIDNDVV